MGDQIWIYYSYYQVIDSWEWSDYNEDGFTNFDPNVPRRSENLCTKVS